MHKFLELSPCGHVDNDTKKSLEHLHDRPSTVYAAGKLLFSQAAVAFCFVFVLFSLSRVSALLATS